MAPINDNDVKLMLAIIASAENIKCDNEKLANIVGNGATANAIRQRVTKIKNQAKAVLEGTGVEISFGGNAKGGKGTPKKAAADKSAAASGNDEDDEETATPAAATPKKRAANGKGKGTPRGKKAKEEIKEEAKEEDEGANEDRSSEESPTKKMKKEDEGSSEV